MRATILFSASLLTACAPTETLDYRDASTEATVPTPTDAATPPPGPAPTWNEQVAPIVFNKCVSCHRAGGIGPFSLETYATAQPFAGAMRTETSARTMPPTVINASGACNSFRGDVAWLTDAEIATIARWAEAGAPEGDPSRRPQPPTVTTGLEGADVRFDIGTSYTPPMDRVDQYRCFLADPGVAQDRFITGFEVVPGDTRVVHHVIVYALPTAEAEAEATRLDAADPMPGYTCFGGPGVTNTAPLVLWAPGGEATRFPEGTGLRLTGGRKVAIQVHYNLLNGSRADRTAVRLRTAPSVSAEARLIPVGATDINIPPRVPMTLVNGERTVTAGLAPRGVRVYGVAPHMHELGRTLRVEARGARATCLSDVTQWNFHWQRLFFYAAPVDVNPGDTLAITCGYDSTSRTVATRRGEGTQDEMCLNYLYLTGR
jgi:hypothetical protein